MGLNTNGRISANFDNEDDVCDFVFACLHAKKGKRKVQGVPQSQTAALPRHKEEEETDNRTETLRLALSSPSEVIAMLKGLKTQEQNNTR